jgi:hypothetical protein
MNLELIELLEFADDTLDDGDPEYARGFANGIAHTLTAIGYVSVPNWEHTEPTIDHCRAMLSYLRHVEYGKEATP